MATHPPQVTYYVILPPQRPDIGASLRPLSRLLQVDEEAARAKLLTPTFEVANRYAKRANAEGLQGQLAALGVMSLVVSDSEIRGHLIMFVSAANQGAGGMAFRDFNDKPLYCPFDDVGSASLLEVPCEDGKTALLIDLHRRSTNITPRLDVSLFNFESVMHQANAGTEQFLALLEEKAGVTIDRRFGPNREQLKTLMRDFGSSPGEFPPPPGMIFSPYSEAALRAANIYSFLLHARMRYA